jgi:hypothetical protein
MKCISRKTLQYKKLQMLHVRFVNIFYQVAKINIKLIKYLNSFQRKCTKIICSILITKVKFNS